MSICLQNLLFNKKRLKLIMFNDADPTTAKCYSKRTQVEMH